MPALPVLSEVEGSEVEGFLEMKSPCIHDAKRRCEDV